ncbi:hypothetical protein QP668_26515, partial [Escherichia coli]|nr:hypothetical protein [Escherichia coli]
MTRKEQFRATRRRFHVRGLIKLNIVNAMLMPAKMTARIYFLSLFCIISNGNELIKYIWRPPDIEQ